MEEFANAQTALFDKFQTMNQQWLDRIQVEANSASEFASKLTSVRTIPDAMAAYQEWASQCLEMVAEDRKHLLDDYRKLSEISMRLLSNGWRSNGFGASA
jgi:Phasin protein